jgi:hypothetical protein
MPDKLLCATLGVPLRFACPPLCSPSELAVFHPIYTTATSIPVQAADSIALLVKSYRTNQVYHTNGGVTEDERLVSTGPRWIVSKEYECQLKGIAKRFRCDYETCVAVDQSFRVKRARRDINVNGRSVVWYQQSGGTIGDLFGSWFDITLTNEAPDITLWERPDDKMARTAHNMHVQQELAETGRLVRNCANCKKGDSKTDRHKKCTGCSKVAYCDRTCQKADWEHHKHQCRVVFI